MHKFFTENIDGDIAVITGDDVKHIWKVLRLKVSDRVLINDLKGTDYLGELIKIDKAAVLVKLAPETAGSSESPLAVTVFQGIPKGQKMDYICQKLSELGVRQILPVRMERTIPENDNEAKKLDRWKRIILEACKQSKRSRITEITPPVDLTEAIEAARDLDLLIVPYEAAEGGGLKELEAKIKSSASIGILVGPEGGITPGEIDRLSRAGAQIITLGPRILRTETCALCVVSILQYLAGDMG